MGIFATVEVHHFQLTLADHYCTKAPTQQIIWSYMSGEVMTPLGCHLSVHNLRLALVMLSMLTKWKTAGVLMKQQLITISKFHTESQYLTADIGDDENGFMIMNIIVCHIQINLKMFHQK